MGSMREDTREALYDRQKRLEELLAETQDEAERARLQREIDELQMTRSDLEAIDEQNVRNR